MKPTQKAIKQYIEDLGGYCPNCKSDKITEKPATIVGGEYWRNTSCPVCKMTWTDVYTLTGITIPNGGHLEWNGYAKALKWILNILASTPTENSLLQMKLIDVAQDLELQDVTQTILVARLRTMARIIETRTKKEEVKNR